MIVRVLCLVLIRTAFCGEHVLTFFLFALLCLLILIRFPYTVLFEDIGVNAAQVFLLQLIQGLEQLCLLVHHVRFLWVIQLHVPFIFKHAFEGLLQIIVRLLVVQGDDEPD